MICGHDDTLEAFFFLLFLLSILPWRSIFYLVWTYFDVDELHILYRKFSIFPMQSTQLMSDTDNLPRAVPCTS